MTCYFFPPLIYTRVNIDQGMFIWQCMRHICIEYMFSQTLYRDQVLKNKALRAYHLCTSFSIYHDSQRHTVCPGSSDPFDIVSYNIKWVTTSWTYSNTLKGFMKIHHATYLTPSCIIFHNIKVPMHNLKNAPMVTLKKFKM